MQDQSKPPGSPAVLAMLSRVINEGLSLEERLWAASVLKDASLESMFGKDSHEYAAWLESFFKPCCDVLRKVEPQLQPSVQHQLRNTMLELLNRLHQNDAFKPRAPELFELCLSVVRVDNHNNSLLAIKIMFDMLKAYKAQMEAQAEQFLELVTQ
ncbi:hypothetical protein DUNSADRAFT_2063, partial [Dunaliella salina]